MAVRVARRSPPDGTSSPLSMSDASIIIPGFLSKSRRLNLPVPSPAPVPLTKARNAPKPSPRTSKESVTGMPKDSSGMQSIKKTAKHSPPAYHQTVLALSQPQTAQMSGEANSRLNKSTSADNSARGILDTLQTRKLVSTPVSGVVQTSRSGLALGTSITVKAYRVLGSQDKTRGIARAAVATEPEVPETTSLTVSSPQRNGDATPLSPISPTSIPVKASTDIPPYFIHPLNLCDPFVDNIGLAEICSLHVNELQYLSQTNQNKPVVIRNGRTVPSFFVRIWARGSGKYLDILSVGELYGRGVFGHYEQLRLVAIGPRKVMIQSMKNSRLHVGIKNGLVTGKGTGDEACHFIIHQGPTGYCLLESLLHPGWFLGVRKNGNIMRPSEVKPDSTEARFVIQREAMAAL